jgi:hypothetical protein
MDAKEAQYVVCRKGVFVLPERVFQSLCELVKHNALYVRQDEEVLTISTQKIDGGHRRALAPRIRAHMFRDARKLAIVNLHESLRVMIVS